MKKILLALLIFTALAGRYLGFDHYLGSEYLMASLESISNTPPLVYMLILALVPVFFLPTFPAVIIAGYLYDPVWGFCYAMVGATIGASLSFLFSRYLAGDTFRDKVLAYIQKKSKRSFDSYMGEQGWKVVLILRLIPLFPFTPLNYALGLSNISFCHYLCGTAVGIAPACALFIFFSASLTELLQRGASPKIIVASALVISFVTLLRLGVKRFS